MSLSRSKVASTLILPPMATLPPSTALVFFCVILASTDGLRLPNSEAPSTPAPPRTVVVSWAWIRMLSFTVVGMFLSSWAPGAVEAVVTATREFRVIDPAKLARYAPPPSIESAVRFCVAVAEIVIPWPASSWELPTVAVFRSWISVPAIEAPSRHPDPSPGRRPW